MGEPAPALLAVAVSVCHGLDGENHFTPLPSALYGAVLLLQSLIIAEQGGRDSKLALSIGKDWKGKLSPVLYAVALGASFFQPWIAGSIYVGVALMWLIPGRRIERIVDETSH